MKRKKSNKQKLIEKCDKLWSKAIRERDTRCAGCGAPASQAAHIFSRSNQGLRHDLLNGIGACYYCHIYRWHREPAEFIEWFQETYPERWKYLQKKRKEAPKPLGAEHYENVLKTLQQ